MPVEQAIIPNRILDDSETMEFVMKIKNVSLKTAILSSKTIDSNLAAQIERYLETSKNLSLQVGMLVFLKLELTTLLPRRLYRIIEVQMEKKLDLQLRSTQIRILIFFYPVPCSGIVPGIGLRPCLFAGCKIMKNMPVRQGLWDQQAPQALWDQLVQ